MKTTIGKGLYTTRAKRLRIALVGCAIVASDLVLVAIFPRLAGPNERLSLSLIAWVLFAVIARGDTRPLWLGLAPLQGWRYWIRVTAFIAVAFGLILTLAFGILYFAGVELRVYTLPPERFLAALGSSCVIAPIVEEAIYRFVLCTAALAVLSPPAVIVVSGFVFGLLHVLYGNPSPENLLAGFLLAWADLKSGTLLVPVVWHGLGNLVAVGSQLASWYVVR